MSDPDAGIVDLVDVEVRLGGSTILDRVSMSVDRGTLVGLIGPNGAGKSTLLRTINGVLEPAAGQAKLDGMAVRAMSPKRVGQLVATVPQDTTIAFDFDVRDVVAMGRTPYRSRFGTGDPEGDVVVREALSLTDTERFANRPIGGLSGGERQRVVLARAIAQETPVLLLDEPTASLDINHQIRTFELVRELVDHEGKAVVAAVHDLNLAAHYCDRLILLSDGRILDQGEPDRVVTESNLDAAFNTRAVVSRHPITGSIYVTALPDRPINERNVHVHVIGGGGSASPLLYVLSSAGFTVTVGALNEGDTDLETARHLGIEAISLQPFSEIGPETERTVRAYVESADVTVVADIEVGTGNRANLEASLYGSSLVVVEDRPFEDRNYAGEELVDVYRRARDRAVVVSGSDVVQAVERLVESDGPAETDGSNDLSSDVDATIE